MGLRQRDWARKERERIIKALGGCCRVCGSTMFLELDCIKPTGDGHHRIEWSWRVSFYRRQLAIGNCQCLCQRCNAKKGADSIEEAFGAILARMLPPVVPVEVSTLPF
jgi:hypothetical protein